MSAAYNGAVVAEELLPAFGQRLAELITYRIYQILVYLKYRLFTCSIASLLCETRELPFVFSLWSNWLL